MDQLEFYKSFQFMSELLLAEAIFLFSLQRRRFGLLRAVFAVAASFLFAWLIPVLSASPAYLSFMFFTLFIFTVCMTKFIFREKWLKLAFCCVAGYTVQHLTYQVNNISLILLSGGDQAMLNGGMYGSEFSPIFSVPFLAVWYYFVIFLVYSITFWTFGIRFSKQEFLLPSVLGFFLVCFLLVFDIVLNTLVVYYLNTLPGIIIAGVYNIVCCILGLVLQFEVLLRWGLFSQLRLLRVVRRQESERYAAVKEAMEIVNIKCHDLKHQIRLFRSHNMLSEATAKDMERAIADYAAFTFTGNSALDIALTENNRTCERGNIRVSYMADGKLLNFMSEEDIYIMFRNLLDNAVEAAMQQLEEKRTMGLRIEKAMHGFVSASVYNYCGETAIEFVEGLPKTTKKQTELHGFGLKSVRRICEKYGGTMDVYVEEEFFNVNMLFPVRAEEKEEGAAPHSARAAA